MRARAGSASATSSTRLAFAIRESDPNLCSRTSIAERLEDPHLSRTSATVCCVRRRSCRSTAIRIPPSVDGRTVWVLDAYTTSRVVPVLGSATTSAN